MKLEIAIHILPQEIDKFQELLIQLKRNMVGVDEECKIKLTCVLNIQLVNWAKSEISSSYFLDRFEELQSFAESFAEVEFISNNVSLKGCNDVRRYVIRRTAADYVMYLDCDNIFSTYMIGCILNVCKVWKNSADAGDYRIITPQVTRMWDATWDIITNDKFLNEPANHETYNARDPYLVNEELGFPKARMIGGFKFAGWGTTIPSKLAKFIDVPDALGPYGLDDTFIMHCCQLMKERGHKISQWVIENQIIMENNKFRSNVYKDYLVIIDKRQEYLSNAHHHFNNELQKFGERLG